MATDKFQPKIKTSTRSVHHIKKCNYSSQLIVIIMNAEDEAKFGIKLQTLLRIIKLTINHIMTNRRKYKNK